LAADERGLMNGDGQFGRVPPVLRDAGDDDGDVYVVGVRESTDPQSWSLLLMECYDEDADNEDADELEQDDGMDTYSSWSNPARPPTTAASSNARSRAPN
jgi:hypothetical protein